MTAEGVRSGSVVKKYSSRCVPLTSRTNAQRTGTSPRPPLYQCPVPSSVSTRLFPPPYHPTSDRVKVVAAATASRGFLRRPPLTRGRPLPVYGGGGSNR